MLIKKIFSFILPVLVGAAIIALLFHASKAFKAKSVEPVPIIQKEEEKPTIKLEEPKKEEPKPEKKEPIPSKEFLQGYWDGYDGKLIGVFRWITTSEYRAGHALGANDKKHDIKRYDKK